MRININKSVADLRHQNSTDRPKLTAQGALVPACKKNCTLRCLCFSGLVGLSIRNAKRNREREFCHEINPLKQTTHWLVLAGWYRNTQTRIILIIVWLIRFGKSFLIIAPEKGSDGLGLRCTLCVESNFECKGEEQ